VRISIIHEYKVNKDFWCPVISEASEGRALVRSLAEKTLELCESEVKVTSRRLR
jgi:hypothetical protein